MRGGDEPFASTPLDGDAIVPHQPRRGVPTGETHLDAGKARQRRGPPPEAPFEPFNAMDLDAAACDWSEAQYAIVFYGGRLAGDFLYARALRRHVVRANQGGFERPRPIGVFQVPGLPKVI